jgi:hypothetical protein
MKKRPDNKIIIEALKASGGIISMAAQKIGFARQTVSTWVNGDPELRAAADSFTDEILDLAELKLIELIRDGDREAIKFFLRCKGKTRGWHDKLEVSTAPGKPLQVENITQTITDLKNLSVEDLKELERISKKAHADPVSPAP